MKIEPGDFRTLVEQAMQNQNVMHMRPVIEKELLHYDILFALDQASLLDKLTFQGGTALRLCYGGNRFSEDLDFAGGRDFDSAQLTDMKQCLEDYIGKRYGLEVNVKEPSSLKQEEAYAELHIDKWQISIITSPERKDLPRQRIKIEVASVPAYTRQPLPLRNSYTFLPDGYEDTLIYTETLDEILADKLIALPATQRYIRHRDIWDSPWMLQQGGELNADLVAKKIQDYRLPNFKQQLTQRIDSLDSIIHSIAFQAEMQRFLPTDVYERTVAKDKFSGYLVQTLTTLLTSLKTQLYEPEQTLPKFKM